MNKRERLASPIAGLWEDIWDYEIKLKSLDSHRITVLLDYVRNLDESSEELKRIKVKRNDMEDKDNKEE